MVLNHSSYIHMRDGTNTSTIRFYPNNGRTWQTGVNEASDHQDSSDARIKKILNTRSGRKIAKHANLYLYDKEGLDKPTIGLIAQDMKKADSALVGTMYHEKLNEILTLSPLSIASAALHGVKELDEEIEDLKKRVNTLEEE
jgi:hypothetical protein